jgi:membrane protein DedA with SNARE-associated domain
MLVLRIVRTLGGALAWSLIVLLVSYALVALVSLKSDFVAVHFGPCLAVAISILGCLECWRRFRTWQRARGTRANNGR